MKQSTRLTILLLLFVILCASLAYWGMQLFKPAERPVAPLPQSAHNRVNVEAAARLFGGHLRETITATNYQLTGVVAPEKGDEAVAIIAVNGKPPQAISVGKEVISGVIVKEVHVRHVVLQENGVLRKLELPEIEIARPGSISGKKPPIAGLKLGTQSSAPPQPSPSHIQPQTQPGLMPPAKHAEPPLTPPPGWKPGQSDAPS